MTEASNAATAPTLSESSTRRHLLVNLALAGIGTVLLLLTIRRVGWADVQVSARSVGAWFAPVLLLGGLRFAARARAWQVCAEGAGLTFGRAFAATLAGDALGNLTPLGLLASEPAKVLFVRLHVPTVAAVSSIAVENAFYMASVLGMIGAGALVFFEIATLSDTLRIAAQAVVAIVMLAGIAGLWAARQRPAVLSWLAGLVTAWTGQQAGTVERLRDIEGRFYAVLTWPAARIGRVVWWEAVFHIAAVAEVFMILRLLPGGRAITLVDAFVLETAGRLIVVAFKFIPYRLGVDEAGTALVARALALDPTMGVTLALVRRLRVLCWNAVGLVMLARSR